MRIPTLAHGLISITLAAAVLVQRRTAAAGHPPNGAHPAEEATSVCPVTTPNDHRYVDEPAGGNHGNESLVTELWPGGRVDFIPSGPGCVEPDGYLGMKWPWWRSVPGPLTIEGRRLDGAAGPLRAHVPQGYGEVGFQSTGVLFAGPGCWEVTGRVGDATLTFVTLIVKTGGGPAPRCSAVFEGFRSSAHSRTREHE